MFLQARRRSNQPTSRYFGRVIGDPPSPISVSTEPAEALSPLLDPVAEVPTAPGPSRCLASAVLLAGILVFAPLAFGAVHTWAYSLVQLALLAAGFCWLAHRLWLLGKTETAVSWVVVKTPLTPLAIFLTCWLVFQMLPLPLAVVHWLSPSAVAIRSLGSMPPPAWAPLSLNPFATKLGLIQFLSLAAVFILAVTALNRSRDLTALILLVAAVGVFEVIYGASQIFARPPRIWGWKNIYGSMRLAGTFINVDHLAAYLEMAFFLTLGLFWAIRPGRRNGAPQSQQGWRAWRQRLVDPAAMDQYTKWLLVFLLVLILATGLILTQSRGGVWAGAVTLASIFLLERARRRDRTPWAAILLFLASLAAYVWLVAGGIDLSRLGSADGFEGRAAMYRGTLAMAWDFLWTGVGLGALPDVFTRYQVPPLLENYIDYVHSDWLQLLAETGLPGFGLVLGGYLYFLYYLWSRWQRRQDRFVLGVGLGCLGAVLSVGFHAAVEFPLHIPANAVLLAVVLALGFAVVHLHRHPWEHFSYDTILLSRPAPRRLVLALGLLLLSGLAFLTLQVWNHWAAERLAPTERDSTRRRVQHSAADIHKAMDKSPGNAAYPALLGIELQRLAASEHIPPFGQVDIEPVPDIADLLARASRSAPGNWRYRHGLGWAYLLSSDPEKINSGLQEVAAARKLFPGYGFTHFSYGAALLYVGTSYPEVLTSDWPRQCAQALQQAVALDPKLQAQLHELLGQYPEVVQRELADLLASGNLNDN